MYVDDNTIITSDLMQQILIHGRERFKGLYFYTFKHIILEARDGENITLTKILSVLREWGYSREADNLLEVLKCI